MDVRIDQQLQLKGVCFLFYRLLTFHQGNSFIPKNEPVVVGLVVQEQFVTVTEGRSRGKLKKKNKTGKRE